MQKTYRGEPTARSRLYALWKDGNDRSNKELAEEIGCSWHTVRTYRQDWNRRHGKPVKPIPDLLDIPPDDLPLLTLHGWMWCEPISMRLNCEKCDMIELCKEAVKDGNFIACERMLEDEVLPASIEKADRTSARQDIDELCR